MTSAMDRHNDKVAQICEQVKARPADKRMSIRKKTWSHQIHNTNWKDTCHRVDVSSLNEIVGFAEEKGRDGKIVPVAICEGQVEMGQLARATLARGFVPKVVPEYYNFTCAGLINGEGIQTSCFKWGVFSHTVPRMEVVLGNGEVRMCHAFGENEDLFGCMVESYGTMGIVTLVVVELIPAKPYVRSKFTMFSDLEEFTNAFTKAVYSQQGDFLEGLVWGQKSYMMIQSTFDDKKPGDKVFDPCVLDLEKGERYYYQVLREDAVERKLIDEDLLETWNFLFRSHRGAWWMMECHLQGLAKFATMRRIADKKSVSELDKNGGFTTPSSDNFNIEDSQRCLVLQDMGILLTRLKEGIAWVNQRLGVYPLWICPVNGRRAIRNIPGREFFVSRATAIERGRKTDHDDFVVDIGIYGEPTVQPYRHRKVLRELEEFVDFPSAWGVSYENHSEVKERNRKIREKFHAAGAFPGVEEKVTFKARPTVAEEEEGPIPCWRLQRDHGRYWPVKAAALVVALITIVWVAFFRAPLNVVRA